MDLRLDNGLPVQLRRIRPDDKPLLAAALESLSDETVRQRFLAPKPAFNDSELRYLTEVDFKDHYAIVAVLPESDGAIVGVARWIRDPQVPEEVEAAVVVCDALQGHGLGRALGIAIADAARARGVQRFTATMLSDNLAAERLFAAVSERLVVTPDGAVEQAVGQLAA